MSRRSLVSQQSILTVILSVFVLSASCTPKIKGWSQESYREPGLSINSLNQEGLALLPVIILDKPSQKPKESVSQAPSGPYAPKVPPGEEEEEKALDARDAYRVIISQILLSKIESGRKDLRLVSPTDALKRLNDRDLTSAYRKFNSDFPRVGLDGTLLESFGSALNCRYLFISQAVISESKSESTLTLVWSFGRRSVLRSVKISGQIWDTVTSQQIWEGSGVGYNRLALFEGAPLTEEMASQAVDSLLENIIR
jgi:hypothetical protein